MKKMRLNKLEKMTLIKYKKSKTKILNKFSGEINKIIKNKSKSKGTKREEIERDRESEIFGCFVRKRKRGKKILLPLTHISVQRKIRKKIYIVHIFLLKTCFIM